MPPVVQVQVQRAPGDCGIAALSTYLNLQYEDVLGAAVKQTRRARVHHSGMFTREITSTAKRLGVALRLRRSFDLETDEGVLTLEKKGEAHAVFLKNGLVFDGDGTASEFDFYLSTSGYKPMSLLVKDED